MLYPLKFQPIFKDKIWGGNKLGEILNKKFPTLPNCGESWEISGVEGNISQVREGSLAGKNLKELIRDYKGDLLGRRVYEEFGDRFPLLIKFIDANDDLSIQVHPDDLQAREKHGGYGKTEMWYIIQADKGSYLISGFNREIDQDTYLDYFNRGDLTEILNKEYVQKDDVFFIPSGRVHSIGKGILLAEIQQTSDTTYRIYDFERKGKDGQQRELHLNEALDAIDYSFYPEYKSRYQDTENVPVQLVSCKYFTTNKLLLNKPVTRQYQTLDSFVALICLDGSGLLTYNEKDMEINKGEVVLIPAMLNEVSLSPGEQMKLLETYVTR